MELLDEPAASARTRRTAGTGKRVVAIRHVHFEDLGSFAAVLRRAGYEVTIYDAGLDDLTALPPDDPDILVVLGGPIGANDEAAYPFLTDEYRLLEKRLEANLPTLGICLGARMIARIAGGRVHAGPTKEIGWGPVTLTPAGAASPLRFVDGPVLHWHAETFDLPRYAELLASTPPCVNQAFALGSNVLALQFHGEIDERSFERWLIGHAAELAQAGADIARLRADARTFAPAAQVASAALLHDWLSDMAIR